MEGQVTHDDDAPLGDYLTVAAVATRFGVERQTVRLWIKGGRMPAIRMGRGVVLIHKKDVDSFQLPKDTWLDAVRIVRAEREMLRRASGEGATSTTPPSPAEGNDAPGTPERTNQ